MNYNCIYYFFLLFVLPCICNAQFIIFPLEENPAIIKEQKILMQFKNKKVKPLRTKLIQIPFFDDFAQLGVYPNDTLWADNNVYINATFAKNPLSIGVATFDAIDNKGKIYAHASTDPFIADYLTSHPINLNYSIDSNIYFSFFYQPEGITGEKPENNDSLILEFLTPSDARGIFINEILAKNTNGITDEFNEYAPWIELYNATDTTVNIGGLYITGDKTNFYKINNSTPQATTIAPYDYIILWADNQPNQGANHISINLSSNGGVVALGTINITTDSLTLTTNDSIFLYSAKSIILKGTTVATINTPAKISFQHNDTITISSYDTTYFLNLTTITIQQIDSLQIVKSGISNTYLCDTAILFSNEYIKIHTIHPVYINELMYGVHGYNFSYGRSSDGNSTTKMFSQPTPLMPNSGWIKVWSSPGTSLTEFKQVIIPINKTSYLKKGFRFRFKNYASINNYYPSRAMNCDFWNIDYVYLNKRRSPADTLYDDVAMLYQTSSLLSTYEAMPWRHFLLNPASEVKNNIVITYKNNGPKEWNITRNFKITDLKGNGGTHEFGNTADNSQAFSTTIYEYAINPDYFASNSIDTGLFKVISFIKTDTVAIRKPYRWNDTTIYYQQFYNYYAYDDGSAENGAGIYGNNTENAMLAYKFHCRKTDTLRAVQIYFNRTFNNASQKYFYLNVWNDNNGIPGEVIYSRLGVKPEYEDSLFEFHTYLIDTTLIINGTFYVGWRKTSNEMLNVGFDLNRNAKDKIYYNISGTWKQSDFEGALMIRPVFGKTISTSISEIAKNNCPIELFPNPAENIVFINTSLPQNTNITIYDIYGHAKYFNANYSNFIDVSNLLNGIYIIKITTTSTSFFKKIIIQH